MHTHARAVKEGYTELVRYVWGKHTICRPTYTYVSYVCSEAVCSDFSGYMIRTLAHYERHTGRESELIPGVPLHSPPQPPLDLWRGRTFRLRVHIH